MPVTEAANKFGVAVTKVAAFGWPVVYVTPPLATAAAGPARNAPARRARPSVMDPDEMEDEIEQAIDDGDVEMGA
jgi:hypothetical protein